MYVYICICIRLGWRTKKKERKGGYNGIQGWIRLKKAEVRRSVQVQGYEVHPVWDQSQGSAAS